MSSKIALVLLSLILLVGLACVTFRSTDDPAPTSVLPSPTPQPASRFTDVGFPSPFGG